MSEINKNLKLMLICVALASPTAPRAQSFEVQKFDIGGTGDTDYITAEPGSGRVFIPRSSHVMVVDGRTGKVLGDIADTPRVHGIALARKAGHGFITNRGDSTVTMFDLKNLEVIHKIPMSVNGLDGIMYDDFNDRVVLTNHSTPVGTAVEIDATTGNIVGTVELEDTAPEGAASDGKGKLFVNNEHKNTMQVIDVATMKAVASWPLVPCDAPTGIAMDRVSSRIFVGCNRQSVVVDANSGKIVATIHNGDGVDALGWDQKEQLIYIPAGRDGTVTVVHEDSPDKYSVVATVNTMRGVKTIAVDPVQHRAYGFVPEFGLAPAPQSEVPVKGPAGLANPASPGPMVAAWLFAISH